MTTKTAQTDFAATVAAYADRIDAMPRRTVDEINDYDGALRVARALGLGGHVDGELARRETVRCVERAVGSSEVRALVDANEVAVLHVENGARGGVWLTSGREPVRVTWQTLRAAAQQPEVELAAKYDRALRYALSTAKAGVVTI